MKAPQSRSWTFGSASALAGWLSAAAPVTLMTTVVLAGCSSSVTPTTVDPAAPTMSRPNFLVLPGGADLSAMVMDLKDRVLPALPEYAGRDSLATSLHRLAIQVDTADASVVSVTVAAVRGFVAVYGTDIVDDGVLAELENILIALDVIDRALATVVVTQPSGS